MKQIIYRVLFVLCFIGSMIGTYAQDVSSPTFVKRHPDLIGFNPSKMSDNGRYVICNIMGDWDNTVRLWDTQLDIVTTIGTDCRGYDVSDDGKVIVGLFANPDVLSDNGEGVMIPTMTGGFYKDGKWTAVDYYPGYGHEEGAGAACVWNISPDGKWMSGYADIKDQKESGQCLRPLLWDANGKFAHMFKVDGYINGVMKYRATPRAMSNDGNKVAGWSEWFKGEDLKGHWIPAFWTGRDVEDPIPAVALDGSPLIGYLEGMNNNGTIAVGYGGDSDSKTHGVIVHDDGIIELIGTGLMDVSENNLFVGKEVYSEKFGLWNTASFFSQLYGLDANDAYFAPSISDNGEYICICTMDVDGMFGTAVARVSGDVLPTIPNKLVLMGGEAGSVNLSWGTPNNNGYVPIGYNVYRGNTKITAELINVLSFNDATPGKGKVCYTVSAVYKYRETDEALESAKSESKCIEVIDEDGCFSPKQLISTVKYNRTVDLAWERPIPNYSKSQKTDGEIVPMQIKPNVIKKLAFHKIGITLHAISDGEFMYCQGQFGGVFKYTLDGEFVENSTIFAMMSIRGLAHDGSKFYTTLPGIIHYFESITSFEGSGTIRVCPSGDLELDWPGATRICYLPFLDDNKGGFEFGEFGEFGGGTSLYLDMGGKVIEGGGIPGGGDIRGVAYYEGKIYVAKREADGGMKIHLYDATTNKATGEYIDMRDYANLQLQPEDKLWGISIMNSSEGIPCLVVSISRPIGWDEDTYLVYLELGQMEGLLGYNVYKNGTKISGNEPLKTTNFSEKIFEAGNYKYEITAIFEGNCESSMSESTDITITPIGVVNEPKNLTAEAIRNNIIVSWEAPKSSVIPKLVGYNLFKNGVQLNPVGQYITDLFYTDKDLSLGEYKYEVNAFYNNSGESVKLSNSINLNGFNPTLAPTELALNKEDRGDVSLTWKTPAMGDYEVKTWHNGNIEDCIGVSKEGGILYVATKWDVKDLSSVFNYALTDIEFYAGNALSYTFYIYIDNKLVGEQTVERAKAKDYNLVKLVTPINIEKGKTVMVACKVTHGAGELPMGISKRNTAIGKGDLTSTDGKNWVSVFESEKFMATWAISVRLMPYTIEPAKEIVGVKMEVNSDKNHKIVGGAVITRNAATAVFKNSEVIGYNVYKNNEKINSSVVTTEEFVDTSADLTKDNCYSIEALFTAGRKSSKSAVACTYGLCAVPTLTGEIKNGYPELKVTAPTEIVANEEIKYYDEEGTNAIGLYKAETYYTLLSLKPTDLSAYDGYTITSINAYLAGNECDASLFAKQGDKVIINQAIKSSDIKVGANEWAVKSPITIDATSGLLIGLKLLSQPNKFTVGTDAGPAIDNKTNVISMDAINLTSLSESTNGQMTGNWNISISLEKRVPLEETCIGYNIYRNNVKVNEIIVTDGVYVDKAVEGNTKYNYHATAIWDTNCESGASKKVELTTPVGINDLADVNIKLYPNPVKDVLNIEGDFETVRLYNSLGQECEMQHAEGEKLSINVSTWAKGIYIIEVTSATGEINRGKVIVK